ncbi:flagellar assembly protein FliH [Polaromonas sp.]|uniref:flagellar assembly protein FliH n=1 Tax=Polaromonas sp. TaxID=1869339 RepID=UPI00326475A5
MDPKDRIAAWKRWEMTSFTHEAPFPPSQVQAIPDAVPEPPSAAPKIDEADLDRLRLEAQMAGEKTGYEQGYAQGQAEGHAAAMAAVHEQARQLRALTLSLPPALHLAEGGVADDLLALAMDLARQVLGRALTADPQAMLAVVHELLQAEPALVGSPQLFLHPDDAQLVSEHLAEELLAIGWRIRPDANILRGGCRVMASSGERDATLETRWDRVAAALARNIPAPSGTAHD